VGQAQSEAAPHEYVGTSQVILPSCSNAGFAIKIPAVAHMRNLAWDENAILKQRHFKYFDGPGLICSSTQTREAPPLKFPH
jgi:hypothetical protein